MVLYFRGQVTVRKSASIHPANQHIHQPQMVDPTHCAEKRANEKKTGKPNKKENANFI
jgi:hypothetical protein